MRFYSVVVTIDLPASQDDEGNWCCDEEEWTPQADIAEDLGWDWGDARDEYDNYCYLDEGEEGTWFHSRRGGGSGILTRTQFETLVEKLGVCASSTETLGTLGGPLSGGMPYCVPDVAFESNDPTAVLSLRATPFIGGPRDLVPDPPSNVTGEKGRHAWQQAWVDRRWDNIRKATIQLFEDGCTSRFKYGDAYVAAVEKEKAKLKEVW